MADDIDLAQERNEFLLKAQIAVRKPEGPEATGECLTCSTALPLPRRWCDADCRDDYERSFLSLR
jgi:hypothetical protein